MSCHSGVIIGFNIMIMALKSLHDTISRLSYILYTTSGASDQVNDIFTLAIDVNFAVEISFKGSGLYHIVGKLHTLCENRKYKKYFVHYIFCP